MTTRRQMTTRWLLLAIALTLVLTSTLSISPLSIIHAESQAEMMTLELNFDSLPDLGADYVYEGWVMVNGAPVSTGLFTVDANGMASQTMFENVSADATAFILTIEPAVGDDPAPSAVHLLAGDIVDGSATLSIAHPAALNTDFASAEGNFILAAPSAPTTSYPNYLNGIWFLDPTGIVPVSSLELPTLPEGWAYEGWAVGPDGPISTGTFTSTTNADSDGGGATAGAGETPPFPGQDFVNPTPINLTGYRAVISVEPVPDNDPAPFTLKPLVSEPAIDAGQAGALQAFGNNADGIPTGGAMLVEPAEMMTLELSFNSLPNLGADYVYEGWVMVNGAPVSTGIFTVDANEMASQMAFDNVSSDATAFILTIEPAVGDDPAPSAVHLLAGDIVDGSATLSIAHPAALNTDFASAEGNFMLAAPSAPTASYLNGIWFLDPTGAAPVASLTLPTLPEGWAYEGWVAGPDGPISTGTFTDVAMADSDGGGATAGTEPTPPFPGQDFVNPTPIDLTGYRAVISVEPVPDNDPAPFTLKPLISDPAIDPGGPGMLQALGNNADGIPTGGAMLVEMSPVETMVLELSFDSLPDLGADYVYEGWVMVNGAPVSTGIFTVDADGMASQMAFDNVNADATAFILTIEPAVGDDPAPSAVHLLAGDIVDGSATLSIAHPAALNTDFASAEGNFMLAAPSAPTASYLNGIWFLDPTGAAPVASLTLPTLPEGWAYEGWVAGPDGPISTGTFTDVAMADSDGGGATAGTEPTPPFPGQDFVNPTPIDLTGYRAVISVEPVPDNSPAPFTLKPLVSDPAIDPGQAGVLQALGNNADGIPTGSAMLVEMTDNVLIKYTDCSLPALGGGAFYEGWLIESGMVHSTGGFTVDADGNLSEDMFEVDVLDKDAPARFILTIEPAGDTDPAPSATHIIGGEFASSMEGTVTATVDYRSALGSDFGTAAGSFILAVPTSTGSDGASYNNGIWFLDPSGAAPVASLDLPTLPNGWAYEGWVVVDGVPTSTGTFTDVAMADSDGAGATAGANAGPPFPGQDFVTNLLDLVDGTAVISVEPFPDDSPDPFVIKPLVGSVADAGGGVSQPLTNNAVDLPVCSVQVMAPTGVPTAISLAHNSTQAPAYTMILFVSLLVMVTAILPSRND